MLRKSIEEGYGHVLSFSGNTQIAITPLSILSRKYTFLFFWANNTFFQTLLFNHIYPFLLSLNLNLTPPFLFWRKTVIMRGKWEKLGTDLPTHNEYAAEEQYVVASQLSQLCSRDLKIKIWNSFLFPIYWFSRECSRFTTVTLNCTICSACYWTLHACCSPWPPIPRRDFFQSRQTEAC